MKRLVSILLGALALTLVSAPVSEAAQNGRISGTVTPAAIAQEVEVCPVQSPPAENCAVPAADGTYLLSGLPLEPVRVEFVPSYHSRYVIQYWNHAATLATAQFIPLSSSQDSAEGIDASLNLGGVIAGTVTSLGGTSDLRGVEVCALAIGVPAGCSYTDAAGEYELPTLRPGAYRVGFFARGPSAEYVSQSYGATAITLAAGEVHGGVNAELALGAQVRGTVTAAVGGTPLASIPVCLFAGTAAAAEQCVFSNRGGQYAFAGLTGGSYQVGFSLSGGEIGGEAGGEEDGYLSQYYDGVASRGAARTLTLVGSQVLSGIDAALATPAMPLLPPLVVPPANPLVAAAPPIAEPKLPTKGCKKGFKKKKVKGKTRCVKAKQSGKSGGNQKQGHHHKQKKHKGKKGNK